MVVDKGCEKAIPGGGTLADAGEGPRLRWYLPMKHTGEWTAALLLLLIVAPVIGVLALLVKMSSPGPAIYSQVRLGRHGRPFRIYKLRSMANNCEAKTGAVWSAGAADPRVTKLGRILRDTHLDELPQLWNVLKGEMCLIGPRPERPEIVTKLERVLPCYAQRLLIRPGVTGLAQVMLPPDADIESVRRKLGYDLHYVREMTPMMDAKILFATAFEVAASGINACGRALVKTEKTLVESHNYGGLTIASGDAWRIGAA